MEKRTGNRCGLALYIVAITFGLSVCPLAAQTGAWTAVASTGAIDPSSLNSYDFAGYNLLHRYLAVDDVIAHYNVTNTFGGGITDRPSWTTLELTSWDNSPTSYVMATLFRIRSCTGTVERVCDVTGRDGLENSCNTCKFQPDTFDFSNSLYYVEIRIHRDKPDIGPMAIGLRIY
ncbi:MAG TPA: hypothetical protein VF173_12615 [Thermoanaerobaculia bacterium]|nr:hypothetical protein [Thermoanaerobaculia bacterium]